MKSLYCVVVFLLCKCVFMKVFSVYVDFCEVCVRDRQEQWASRSRPPIGERMSCLSNLHPTHGCYRLCQHYACCDPDVNILFVYICLVF